MDAALYAFGAMLLPLLFVACFLFVVFRAVLRVRRNRHDAPPPEPHGGWAEEEAEFKDVRAVSDDNAI